MEKRMTDAEVLTELRSDSPLNQARKALSGVAGSLEQAGQQRRPANPIEIRRMEFEGVRRIVEALGMKMHTGAVHQDDAP